MRGMCNKCCKVSGRLWLIFGIIFLLQNLGSWDFWGIQWFTILFLLMGIGGICMAKCPDCCKA